MIPGTSLYREHWPLTLDSYFVKQPFNFPMEIKNRLSSVLHTGPQRVFRIPRGDSSSIEMHSDRDRGWYLKPICLLCLPLCSYRASGSLLGHTVILSILGALEANDLISVPLLLGLPVFCLILRQGLMKPRTTFS